MDRVGQTKHLQKECSDPDRRFEGTDAGDASRGAMNADADGTACKRPKPAGDLQKNPGGTSAFPEEIGSRLDPAWSNLRVSRGASRATRNRRDRPFDDASTQSTELPFRKRVVKRHRRA